MCDANVDQLAPRLPKGSQLALAIGLQRLIVGDDRAQLGDRS
jgi:hypothetical protein